MDSNPPVKLIQHLMCVERVVKQEYLASFPFAVVPRDGREVVGTLDLKPKPPGSFFFEGHYCYSSLKKKKGPGTSREREKMVAT